MLSKNKPQLHLELAVLGGSQEVRIIDYNNTTLKSLKVAPGDGLIRKRTIMQIKTIIVPPTPHDSIGVGRQTIIVSSTWLRHQINE
ncbi:hypothetical protein [Paenibacillus amylolyticus]|uniref:hypothetical protein n=1 Tax=Paenibacillus amylolyticus TaxID=1451 RepID=UPI00286AE404|nr:hypothetical protein [Paenibacillus amylolyticus]